MRVIPSIVLAAALLAGCATGQKPTDAEIQNDIQIVDLAYTSAKIGVAVLCASSPNVPPCNSAAAMAQIAKAEAVLDVALVSAKSALQASRDATDIEKAMVAFKAALDVYKAAWAQYGVAKGGM